MFRKKREGGGGGQLHLTEISLIIVIFATDSSRIRISQFIIARIWLQIPGKSEIKKMKKTEESLLY